MNGGAHGASAGADTEWRDGALYSTRFADIYASRQGALAQARTVFLQGSGLPARWRGRSSFHIAELGFGTGLNMLATLDLWEKTAPPDASLRLTSIEAYPLPRSLAAIALAPFAELAPLARPLLAQWPAAAAAGRQRLHFPALRATLDLYLMEARAALRAIKDAKDKADCWFLDGFSPAKNPAMWSDELLAAVGACTRAGGTAATWSVAGRVRRALHQAGFDVRIGPGFGRKHQTLRATRRAPEGDSPPQSCPDPV